MSEVAPRKSIRALRCPDCARSFRKYEWQGVRLLVCSQCRGAFVTVDDLKRLALVLRGKPEGDQPLLQPARPDQLRRHPCPACNKLMEVHRIAGASTHVDVCFDHGIWLEPGELGQIVDELQARPSWSPGQRGDALEAGIAGAGPAAPAPGGAPAPAPAPAPAQDPPEVGSEERAIPAPPEEGLDPSHVFYGLTPKRLVDFLKQSYRDVMGLG